MGTAEDLQLLLWLVSTAFIAGVGWMAIKAQGRSTASTLKEIKQEVEDLSSELAATSGAVGVIRNELLGLGGNGGLLGRVDRLERGQEDMARDIADIKGILGQRHGDRT